MEVLWLVISIAMFTIEISTLNLVSIWFALGALITCILALFVESLSIQIMVFAISSIIIFLALKPFAKKIVGFNIQRTNLDRVIGKIGLVTKDITKLEPGEVKVEGLLWSATAKSKIEKGSKVEVLAIEGVKLQVKKIEDNNES